MRLKIFITFEQMKRLFTHNLNYKRTLKKFDYNLQRLCSIALVVRGNHSLKANFEFADRKRNNFNLLS